MPDRLIRAELLTSEAWLALKSNDDRVCWIVLLLNADNMGNQPAGPHRLVHLWRHAGIDSTEKAAKVLLELSDVDLVRQYEADGKPYLHIPRFRQSLRYVGRLWALSPWTTDEEKQRITNKSRADHSASQVITCEPPVEVDVDVEVEVRPKNEVQERGASPSARASRATRLPEDWTLPQEWHGWAVKYGMQPAKAWQVGADFHDFWIAKPGSAGTKLNWSATWRRWVRQEMARA